MTCQALKQTAHAFTLEYGHKNIQLILIEPKPFNYHIPKNRGLWTSLTHPINFPNCRYFNYSTA
jgi:hypothetical protein